MFVDGNDKRRLVRRNCRNCVLIDVSGLRKTKIKPKYLGDTVRIALDWLCEIIVEVMRVQMMWWYTKPLCGVVVQHHTSAYRVPVSHWLRLWRTNWRGDGRHRWTSAPVVRRTNKSVTMMMVETSSGTMETDASIGQPIKWLDPGSPPCGWAQILRYVFRIRQQKSNQIQRPPPLRRFGIVKCPGIRFGWLHTKMNTCTCTLHWYFILFYILSTYI